MVISANAVRISERIRLKRPVTIRNDAPIYHHNTKPPREQTLHQLCTQAKSNHGINGDAWDCVTSISNSCEKYGKGDDLCAYIDWADRHLQKNEDKTKKKKNGGKGKEGEGEAETAGFVRRYPVPVVKRGLMATW
jgi:hypothetical protein